MNFPLTNCENSNFSSVFLSYLFTRINSLNQVKNKTRELCLYYFFFYFECRHSSNKCLNVRPYILNHMLALNYVDFTVDTIKYRMKQNSIETTTTFKLYSNRPAIASIHTFTIKCVRICACLCVHVSLSPFKTDFRLNEEQNKFNVRMYAFCSPCGGIFVSLTHISKICMVSFERDGELSFGEPISLFYAHPQPFSWCCKKNSRVSAILMTSSVKLLILITILSI